jgi:hypothetical protein
MIHMKGSRARTTKCQAIGCTWATEFNLPMCQGHWNKVPTQMQRDYWAAFRAFPNKNPDRAQLMGSEAFVEAVANTIEHIAHAEGRVTDNSYRAAANALRNDREKNEKEDLAQPA